MRTTLNDNKKINKNNHENKYTPTDRLRARCTTNGIKVINLNSRRYI